MANSTDRNGRNGGMLITSATGAVTVAGNQVFTSVDILDDSTTFSVLTNPAYAGAALTSRTWMRGDRIYGITTAITVLSGTVLAHTLVQGGN